MITFTGADNATDQQAMDALANDYPVEFGILFSPARTGEARYPTPGWVTALGRFAAHRPRLRLSAHLCGDYSRELRNTGTVRALFPLFTEFHFTRCQVNTARADIPLTIVRDWALAHGMQPILQSRDPARFPDRSEVSWLYDCSGGRGQAPAQGWPIELGMFTRSPRLVGFAGGLGPANVAKALQVIGTRAGRYWIDMESGVSNAGGQFDIGMCRAVCEAVYGPAGSQG